MKRVRDMETFVLSGVRVMALFYDVVCCLGDWDRFGCSTNEKVRVTELRVSEHLL